MRIPSHDKKKYQRICNHCHEIFFSARPNAGWCEKWLCQAAKVREQCKASRDKRGS
jgi:hypothetical protein